MFEAVDPQVFKWYIKTVIHSQLVQLECTRQSIWSTNDVWGRIVTL